MSATWLRPLIVAGLIAGAAFQAAATGFVATSFRTNSIHLLDAQLQPVSSFKVDDLAPNAVTADRSLIYAGFFTSSSVVAYNHQGVEQFRWWQPELFRVQGIALIGSWLAAASDDMLYLYEAGSGQRLAQLVLEESVEGLAYDGQYLWSLGSTLQARDVNTGAVVKSVPNAVFSRCDYGGTGISAGPAGQLVLGCDSGLWLRVSSLDGSVLAEGHNGLDMFDLAMLPAPEPSTTALAALGGLLLAFVARRRRR